jgi:hypothetical protein
MQVVVFLRVVFPQITITLVFNIFFFLSPTLSYLTINGVEGYCRIW